MTRVASHEDGNIFDPFRRCCERFGIGRIFRRSKKDAMDGECPVAALLHSRP